MKKISTIVILIILFILIIGYAPVRNKLKVVFSTPVVGVESKLSIVGQKIGHTFSFIGSIKNLKKDNEELANKLLNLEIDRSRISELEHENAVLKNEIGFMDSQKEESLIPARIIGRETVSFLDSFIIDKGSNDGVVMNMTVVSGGALVGQVSELYEKQAKVTMITSKNSIILAMLQDSRSKGILRGGISGLVLEDITQDVEYKAGEFVVTSGLDGQMQPGILIGKTSGIKSGESDLFKNIIVEPSVDLSKLEIVFLMK